MRGMKERRKKQGLRRWLQGAPRGKARRVEGEEEKETV